LIENPDKTEALQKGWGRSPKPWGRLWGRKRVEFGGDFGGEALK